MLYRHFTWLQADLRDIDIELHCHLDKVPEVATTLLISDRSRVGLSPVAAREAISWLGRDTDRVIFDAFAGFNPNAFAQVCGTLKGGGEFILLSPPSTLWPGYDDPEYRALRGSRYHDTPLPGRFIQRLVKQLATYKPTTGSSPSYAAMSPYLSQQQAELVNALVKDFTGPVSTSVITADRGRGKTTALGLALRSLAAKQPLSVIVTAPNRHAVDALFGALQGRDANHAPLHIRFYPPAVLLDKLSSEMVSMTDVLIVDEAAAISVSILQQLQQRFSRCWYATTLHGYEGNARGFEYRFLANLKEKKVPWQGYHLTQPVRWAEGDPLEALSYRLLLLDADNTDMKNPCLIAKQHIYQQASQADLIQQEPLLRQLFGLLITAHYRTTPNDLRQLLDSPDLHVRFLSVDDLPVAVALLVDEGPLPTDLVEPVWAGYRRPSGDLIPQTLVSREGCRSAASLRGWRIMRIAVHPSYQRQGLGQELLSFIHAEATNRELDFCGASFAANTSLLRFWMTHQYVPLRLGERKDHVTAGWPLLVFHAFSDRAKQVSTQVQQAFSERLLLQLSRDQTEQQLQMLLACAAGLQPCISLPETVMDVVKGFAFNQRGLDDSLLGLRHWLMSAEVMALLLQQPDNDKTLLVGRVLQLLTAEQLTNKGCLKGKRAQLIRLREIVSVLVHQSDRLANKEGKGV